MRADKLVTIIIRTKNEERWITQCLSSVFSQNYKNFEVVLVDNKSSDKTIEKAKQFKIHKIVDCVEYLPGKALNIGIKVASGEFIACLSGHCIPVNNDWLGNLVRNFDDHTVAGVYGRQEPMSFSTDSDKRDLALVFGMDRKVQLKDSFFHNANSMIRKAILDKMPFDDKISNIEDRVWAQAVLEQGLKIIYEPEASVYHYHGIHQDGNPERCTNVVRILESLHKDFKYKTIDIEKMNITVIIPAKGDIKLINNVPLISYTIRKALESKYIKNVIVSTDNPEMAKVAESLGAKAPFIREQYYSRDDVDLDKVMRYSLQKIEELKIFPDLVMALEPTFPFRPKGLIDEVIEEIAESGLDSVVAAKRENKAIWKDKDGNVAQLDEGLTPRKFKDPTCIELRGVAAITHPEFIRNGSFMGNKVGLFEIDNPFVSLEVRDKEDLKLAAILIEKWESGAL